MFIGSIRLTDGNPEFVARVCPHEMVVYTDDASGEVLHAHDHAVCREWSRASERRAIFTLDRIEDAS